MGENRHLNEDERKRYWVSFLNKADLIVGLDNCSVEMKALVPREKLRVFWDTGDYHFYSQPVAESREELRKKFNSPQWKAQMEAMQKQGVILRPMAGYQLPEWVRVSIGTPQENERCLGALKAALKR